MDSTMEDEPNGKFDWVPLTPAKSIPSRYDYNSAVEASLLSEDGAFDFGSDLTKPSNELKNEIPQRKNQEKKPKRKRHVPKVYDRTKPKRKFVTPKPVNPSTPKPRTPKRPRFVEKNSLTKALVVLSKDVDQEEVDDCNAKNCRRKLDFVPTTEKATMNESLELGRIVSKRTMRSRTLSQAIKDPTNEMSTSNIHKVARRKRTKKSTCKNDLFYFFNDLSKLQLSENFLLLASSIGTKEKLVQDSVDHRELHLVSCNESIHNSLSYMDGVEMELPQHRGNNYRDCDKTSPPSFIGLFDDEHEDDVSSSQDYDLYTKALVDFSSEMMAGLHISNVLNQLVLRNQNDALFASKENSDSSEKHKPKVDIDAESKRISKLPIGVDEFNGDGDKAKYWEDERKLFEGRLDQFISVMNPIQGDMHFSPWKGSVVDSVIGVFLTQNVTDHLSSKSFMAIASKFPAPSVGVSDSAIHDSELLRIAGGSFDDVDPEQQLSIIEKDVTSCPTEVDQEDGSVNSSQTESTFGKRKGKNEDKQDWEELRLKYSTPRNRTYRNHDSVNWEMVRQTSFGDFCEVIKERGMYHLLSSRIKDFLERLVRDHGSIDLEWLRDFPPEQAKKYLLSIPGLGLKSVECVRLLSLQQQAFPVDVNIARVTTRLGWIPLKPLPLDFMIHQLEDYPILDDVQTYLWPRVKHLSHGKLYEAHCHLILFGKAICTKEKPNCGACPFRASCKHYASMCASARPRIEGPHVENMASQSSEYASSQGSVVETSRPILHGVNDDLSASTSSSRNCEPFVETPKSPVRNCKEADVGASSQLVDIEDMDRVWRGNVYTDSKEEIMTLNLCSEKKDSKALVVANEITTYPRRPLVHKKRLRTEHHVYELPDSHPLLEGFEKREQEDKYPYLLAIWMPTKENGGQESTEVVKYQDEHIVKGTILIPCRTATRGSFPLNGTYFQENEVFADHESSEFPIDVPREWVWYLNRRALYCSSLVTSLCKEMSNEEITYLFTKASMCTKGFDKITRAPKELDVKLHKGYKKEENK